MGRSAGSHGMDRNALGRSSPPLSRVMPSVPKSAPASLAASKISLVCRPGWKALHRWRRSE
eukprot:12577264-Heterocapsa_arctica.AAC.1